MCRDACIYVTAMHVFTVYRVEENGRGQPRGIRPTDDRHVPFSSSFGMVFTSGCLLLCVMCPTCRYDFPGAQQAELSTTAGEVLDMLEDDGVWM